MPTRTASAFIAAAATTITLTAGPSHNNQALTATALVQPPTPFEKTPSCQVMSEHIRQCREGLQKRTTSPAECSRLVAAIEEALKYDQGHSNRFHVTARSLAKFNPPAAAAVVAC